MQVVAAAAMEAPAGGDPDDAQGRAGRASSARSPTADPAHYVRGQYDGYRDDRRRRAGLDDRDLRRAAARHRELALVGRAVLHPHRQAPAGDADRAAARLQAAAAARLRARSTAARAEPARRSSSTRRPASGSSLDAHRADADGAGADHARHGVRARRAARAPTPYEVLLHAAMRRRQHALHAPGRRRGGVADHAAAARRAAAGAPVRAGHRGGRRRPTTCVAGHGRWHGPVDGGMSDGALRRRSSSARGAGGGTLARHLAPSGKRILLLERGDWLPREPRELARRTTCSSTTATSRRTPGTTSTARPFQPQVHYFVGGATKLYGAALYRLRPGGLRRAAPPRRHLAGLADLLRRARAVLHARRAALRGARRPRRGPDRAAARARRTRSRRSRTSRASSSSPTTSRRPGYHPFHAPCGDPARRGEPAVQRLRALRELRRLPVPRARQVRRRGARRPAGARAPERHAADERARR